jgi:hypothetical protein
VHGRPKIARPGNHERKAFECKLARAVPLSPSAQTALAECVLSMKLHDGVTEALNQFATLSA